MQNIIVEKLGNGVGPDDVAVTFSKEGDAYIVRDAKTSNQIALGGSLEALEKSGYKLTEKAKPGETANATAPKMRTAPDDKPKGQGPEAGTTLHQDPKETPAPEAEKKPESDKAPETQATTPSN